MANLNRVTLIGRLTREPESRTFQNGGRISKFGLAVQFIPSKKNPTTGEWEGGEPAFIDIDAFNSPFEGGRRLADLVQSSLHKGQQVFVAGRLRLNTWTDSSGNSRSKLLVVADDIQFLESRTDRPASAPTDATPSLDDSEPPSDSFPDPQPEPESTPVPSQKPSRKKGSPQPVGSGISTSNGITGDIPF